MTPDNERTPIEKFAKLAATHHTCGGMPQCAACFVELRARISALEAERDEKDAALYEYESHLLAAGFATVNELRTAKESAESRLAIAVEALREIANLFGECPHDGRHDYDDDAQIAACAIQIAESAVSRIDREALAKINASQNATLPPVEE